MYFYLNHQLGWIEVFFPKRFLYKYFREITGKQYFIELSPFKIKKYSSSVQNNIKGNWLEIKKADSEQFMFSQVFQNDFYKQVDLENPRIKNYLDEISEPYVKKYIQQFYENAKRGLSNFREIGHIYNLEIFLKNLTK